MPKGNDRPQPRFDQDASENEILALGLITGGLAVSPLVNETQQIVMQIVLANRSEDHPRLFLRFPGVLKSEYEITLHLVPGTAVAEGDEQVAT